MPQQTFGVGTVPLVLKVGERVTLICSSGCSGSISVPGEAVAQTITAGAMYDFGDYSVQREVVLQVTTGTVSVNFNVDGSQYWTQRQADSLQAAVSADGNTTKNDPSAAAANRSAINALLAAGRPVVLNGLNSDIVWVNGHITMPDNGVLETRGPAIKMAAGVTDYVIGTAAEEASYSSVTVTWSAGRVASIAWTAHGLVVGDAIVLQGVVGTTARQWFDVVRVHSVTDADNVVVELEWLPTAGPSGAMTAKRCTRNIRVVARVNHNYSGGNDGSGRTRMASVMSFVADSYIDITGDADTAKYVCLLAGAINVTGQARGVPKTTSDTLKFYGPARNVRMHANGHCPTEDCATFQPYEPSGFRAYMPCWGEINGVTLDRPEAITGGGSGAIVVYGDTVFGMSALVINGGRAVSHGSTPGLRLRYGEGNPSSEMIGDITVNGTQIASAGSHTVQVENFKCRSLNFVGAQLRAPIDATLRLFNINGNSVIRRLVFRDMDIDLGTWPGTSWQAILLDGAIEELVFDHCSIRGSSVLRMILVNTSSSVRMIRFSGCDVRGIDQLVYVQTGVSIVPRIVFDGGYYEVTTCVAAKLSGVVVEVSAGTVFNNATNGILRYDTAATSGVLIDHGASLLGTSVALTGVSGGQVELRGPNTSFALASSALKRVSGSRCLASVLAGTIPAGHPVICDGTSWYSQIDPTKTYT